MTRFMMSSRRAHFRAQDASSTDYLSLKKSYHTFIADVTNTYFHVDEDEQSHLLNGGIRLPCSGDNENNFLVEEALGHSG